MAASRVRVAAAAACAAAIAAGSAAPLDGAATLAGLQRWLDGTRDLRGRFTQRLVSGALGTGIEESGRLWVARPGRMRWEYLDPEPKIAVVRDGRTWLYLEGDAQLIRGRLDEQEDWLPALLGGTRRLAELFEPVGPAERGADGALRLRVVPRGSTEAVQHLTIGMRAPEFAIETVELLDAAGNRTIYRFSALERNRGVDPRRFVFEAPPGTQVSGEP